MIPASLPTNEALRIADLEAIDLLDTPAEERFDRIVRLAERIFEVPIAYIALIDADRQWFKARCGLSVDQTGREVSFCSHTILQDEILVVPDAREDDRFHDNPLVVGDPFIRFYAGCPLAGPGGTNIGTLCLADTRPRQPTSAELELLGELAAVAQREIGLVDLVRSQQELLEAREALAVSQRRLARELADAASYLESVVPPPVDTPAVRSAHLLIPSSELGGDMLGVMPLDESGRQMAIFLLDVSGHGVAPSLLSVTVGNALGGRTLKGVDFSSPASVLTGLNEAFPIDRTDGRFFTGWYGVYDALDRSLRFASAGHHPAVFLPPGGHGGDVSGEALRQLGEPGPLIGMFSEPNFAERQIEVAAGSLLYLFSDGAFEVVDAADSILGYDAFAAILTAVARDPATTPPNPAAARLEAAYRQVLAWAGHAGLGDDFALLEVAFG